MFNKLTDKALQLPIDTEDRLTGVINLVFEKVGNGHYNNMSIYITQLRYDYVADISLVI